MTDLEDCFVAEARRHGWQPNKGDMIELAICMAGSQVRGDFIQLPSGHSIHVRDAVKSIRASREQHKQDTEQRQPAKTLTERMRREVERERRSLPSDWETVRRSKAGVTASMMDEIAATNPRYAGLLKAAFTQD
ncbi:hypothetical protein [Tardiphaga sp. 862_B3_N1_1]|uniref:hypothetical protein n=1 Tax=Tardiphaga sp. 862_B3_N1_1 TaxID=3240763 RepID=UPI003F8ADB86